MPPDIPEPIIRALAGARSAVALTGAGVSAESGVPTFREAQSGLWSRHTPEQLATPGAFARDPALVTRWYDMRRERLAAVRPNPGHRALAELEREVESRAGAFTLLTQNVDGLHHGAGARNIVELHGSIWVWRCTLCGEEREDRVIPFPAHPPPCLREGCGGIRRPGVVWFGEALPERALAVAYAALARCDLFLSIGTSALVHPSAGFADLARRAGARTVEINPEPTPITGLVDWAIGGRSGVVLPALVRGAFPGAGDPCAGPRLAPPAGR